MALDKEIEIVIELDTMVGRSTIPADPGGTECSSIVNDMTSQLALTLEGSFPSSGTMEAHVRTSPVGGTDPAVWDTEDFWSGTIVASGAGRVQKTFVVPHDPLYQCVQIVNPGALSISNVKATRTSQEVGAV